MPTTTHRAPLPSDVRRRIAIERRRRRVRRVVRRLERVRLSTWLIALGLAFLLGGIAGIAYDALALGRFATGWVLPAFAGIVPTCLGLGERDLERHGR